MLVKELQRKDLNSLVTLFVLLDEQSVSKTADRLFLTQPAVSKALARLRDSFGDPLFVRSGQKLVPTPFASSLKSQLEMILNNISELYTPEEFNPKTYKGEFKIGIVEGLDMTFVPGLMEKLHQLAPGIVVNTYSQLEEQVDMLKTGALDFVVAPRFELIEEEFESNSLVEDRAIVIGRHDHPLRQKTFVSMEECLNYKRVLLHMPDFDRFAVIKEQMIKLREDWEIGFESDNMITAISTVSRTDFLLPAPSMVMMFAGETLSVRPISIDNTVQPILDYHILNAKRVNKSAAHMWMRQFIIECGAEFGQRLKTLTRQFNARLKV